MNQQFIIRINEILRRLASKELINTLVIVIPVAATLWYEFVERWSDVQKAVALILYLLLVLWYTFWEVVSQFKLFTDYKTIIQYEARQELLPEIRDINSLLTAVHDLLPDPRHFRVSLFVYEPDALKLKYFSGYYSLQERELTFGRRQGLVGQVLAKYPLFDENYWFYADLRDVTDEILEKQWLMTPAQIEATHHLTLIIAIPITNGSDTLAILAIDSDRPFDKHLSVDWIFEDDPELPVILALAAEQCAELLLE